MKKHLLKNILNIILYATALVISVAVISFCGYLVFYCLREFFSHSCCCNPCKDANYIVAVVTALVGISASVISIVSMVKNTYSKNDDRQRVTVEFITKFKADIESLYFLIITTQKYNKDKYYYDGKILKYCELNKKFELNLVNLNLNDDQKATIIENFAFKKYIVGWLEYIRKSNYSFILDNLSEDRVEFCNNKNQETAINYVLRKNSANFISLVRNLCKLLDDTIFRIYKENLDRKLINNFLDEDFNKYLDVIALYVSLYYNDNNSCEYKNLVNYLKNIKKCKN